MILHHYHEQVEVFSYGNRNENPMTNVKLYQKIKTKKVFTISYIFFLRFLSFRTILVYRCYRKKNCNCYMYNWFLFKLFKRSICVFSIQRKSFFFLIFWKKRHFIIVPINWSKYCINTIKLHKYSRFIYCLPWVFFSFHAFLLI